MKKKILKILSGFAIDLAKISGDPPETISARTTLMVHTVIEWFNMQVIMYKKVSKKKCGNL